MGREGEKGIGKVGLGEGGFRMMFGERRMGEVGQQCIIDSIRVVGRRLSCERSSPLRC